MTAAVLSLLLASSAPVARDEYGVPHIKAASWREAFVSAGYAVAQDRLWQMENSRRVARGQMAEAFGARYADADAAVLKVGYTDAELDAQFQHLPPAIREAFEAYTVGVNQWISEAKSANTLPPGYDEAGLSPRPWEVRDSAAISIWFLRQFGKGGEGEIRNYALSQYLSSQKPLKGRLFDVMDDFAWQNDPSSPTTVSDAEDPLRKSHVQFPAVSRAQSEAHYATLPKVGLLELLPALRLSSLEEPRRLAERVAAPFKTGSYAIVVGKDRSRTGVPALLSAPQMGHTNPAVVHEMSIEAPGIKVVGMDLPGVPGVLIGHTEQAAWGFTTGVADTMDVVFSPWDGAETYTVGGAAKKLETIRLTLHVKGEADRTVTQLRTEDGPVLLASRGAKTVFSRRASFAGREMESMEALFGLYSVSSLASAKEVMAKATMNFNAFFALKTGDYGWQYAGRVPKRAPGYDPRFPIPAEAKWQGYLTLDEMPHVFNPKSGLICNWNNKPVSWWPNWDTPVWGAIFRNQVLQSQLPKGQVSVTDMERAAWAIARIDENWAAFAPYLQSLPDTPQGRILKGYDGWSVDGSEGAGLFKKFIKSLREELFSATLGSMMSPEYFDQALQPSYVLRALQGKTKIDYRRGRSASEVVNAAFARAAEQPAAPWVADGFPVIGETRIPYGNRGSYIQLVTLGSTVRGRNVLPPGVAESGPHMNDQVPLARAWLYKAMKFSD